MLNATFSMIFKHCGHPHQNVTKMIVQKTAILRTLGQKSIFDPKIHMFKSQIKNFTFLKSHFYLNSNFQNRIFHKNHIFKIVFFTKFTF